MQDFKIPKLARPRPPPGGWPDPRPDWLTTPDSGRDTRQHGKQRQLTPCTDRPHVLFNSDLYETLNLSFWGTNPLIPLSLAIPLFYQLPLKPYTAPLEPSFSLAYRSYRPLVLFLVMSHKIKRNAINFNNAI